MHAEISPLRAMILVRIHKEKGELEGKLPSFYRICKSSTER